jgi:hypothetical protein
MLKIEKSIDKIYASSKKNSQEESMQEDGNAMPD